MHKNEDDKLQSALSDRTTLRTWLTAIMVALVGVVLLILSALLQPNGAKTVWSNLIGSMGDLLIASVAVATLWELSGKRAFVDELLSKVRLSHEVVSAGITGVTHDFSRGTDWETLFSAVQKLDIFVAYARTWRNTHLSQLQAVARRRGARIRIVLPDPDDDLIVSDLARRFGYSSTKVRELIQEAEEDFRKLRPSSGQRCTSVSLWYLRASPQFSFYRFDRTVVLALYSHSHERSPVPTLTLEQGGSLYDFARQEFAAMIDGDKGLSRLVWEQSI